MLVNKLMYVLLLEVLIVAKCIVNQLVYELLDIYPNVLIVAKCIVNREYTQKELLLMQVLIVAKCIVNFFISFSNSLNKLY